MGFLDGILELFGRFELRKFGIEQTAKRDPTRRLGERGDGHERGERYRGDSDQGRANGQADCNRGHASQPPRSCTRSLL